MMEVNMQVLAKCRSTWPPSLQCAVVRKNDRTGLVIRTDTADLDAAVAVSCLVRPEPGDKVLMSTDDMGDAYVLAILARPANCCQPTRLAFDGEVELQVRNGGLAVTSEKAICFAARDVELDAHTGKMRIGVLSVAGNLIESQVEKIKLVAKAMDAVIRRTVQRVASSYRYVEEHDEIQSASTRILVDGTLTMQTKNTMHSAEGHIKIDAEQIHLG